MRKSLSVFSVLALSVGIAMSSAPAQAALPLMANNQEMPSLAPVLEQVTPAVVNISVSGKKITRQRLPEQFRFFFGPNMPDEQVSEQPFQALGSGVIIDAKKGYVITNAHVVAGSNSVTVQVDDKSYDAKVVSYDPEADISILDAPDLPAAPLKFDMQEAATGTGAVVMGYPGGGEFAATPARIREVIKLNGPDIYHSTTVTREVYTIRGNVRQGNSGGPLIDGSGKVLGVVFGAAVDDADRWVDALLK